MILKINEYSLCKLHNNKNKIFFNDCVIFLRERQKEIDRERYGEKYVFLIEKEGIKFITKRNVFWRIILVINFKK